MADRLSKSLDELIAEKDQSSDGRRDSGRRVGGGRGGGGGGGGKVAGSRGRGSFGAVRGGGNRSRNLHSEPYKSDGRPPGFEHDDRVPMKETRQPVTSAIPVNPFRSATNAVLKPRQPTATAGSSVFSRLGTQQSAEGKVIFKNLRETVDKNDLAELCNTVGLVSNVDMKEERSGRKTAFVTFSNRNEASLCVEKFNGLTLDGYLMEVELVGGAPKSVFDRLQTPSAAVAPDLGNVRAGIFGTALQQDAIGRKSGNKKFGGAEPSFSVTLSAPPPDAVSASSNRGFTGFNGNGSNSSSGAVRSNGGGKGGGGGNRAGGRKGGNGSDRGNFKKPVTDSSKSEDLDAELEAYFKK